MGRRKGNSWLRAGLSIARLGLHMVNKLCTVLLLRAPTCMCRASVGWRFCKDKAVRSSNSKTWIIPYYIMFIRRSSLCSCYSLPLLSYVPPGSI